jgi:hypothetical protein
MLEQDVPEFARLMARTGELYGKVFTAAMVNEYWNLLKKFELEEVQKGFDYHFGDPDKGDFLPRPASIVAAITGTSLNQALLAWTKVHEAIHSVGRYASIIFDDAIIHAVIKDAGGWKKICNVDDYQLPFVSKEFQDRYRGYVGRKLLNYPKYLIGVFENQNSTNSHKYDPPILFGDAEKARQVFLAGSYVSLYQKVPLLINTTAIIKT